MIKSLRLPSGNFITFIFSFKEAEKEKERSTNAIIYEVKIENGSTRKKLIFDATGAFLRVG